MSIREEAQYYTRRFKNVVFYCPYIYYDEKDKVFRCAEYPSKTSKSYPIMCCKCRRPGLSVKITEKTEIDLRELNG